MTIRRAQEASNLSEDFLSKILAIPKEDYMKMKDVPSYLLNSELIKRVESITKVELDSVKEDLPFSTVMDLINEDSSLRLNSFSDKTAISKLSSSLMGVNVAYEK